MDAVQYATGHRITKVFADLETVTLEEFSELYRGVLDQNLF
jgi:hypothetical protein